MKLPGTPIIYLRPPISRARIDLDGNDVVAVNAKREIITAIEMSTPNNGPRI